MQDSSTASEGLAGADVPKFLRSVRDL